MQRAAIYVRVSTKKVSQRESPEHQLAACREFCEKNGFTVVEVYEDRASGMSLVNRPNVQRLVFDARDDKFDVVVFTQLSRLARKAYDFDVLMGQLVDICKKRVIGVEDAVDSFKEGNDFVTRILSMMAQKQSEQISIASRRGLKQSGLKGNYTGTYAPYGYKKAVIDGRKTLVIDEESARVVRLIFDLYVNHKMGEKKIVNYLNGEPYGDDPNQVQVAIPSPRKGLWGITTIQRILQNEAYTGRNVFCKYTSEEFFNKETMDLLDRTKKLVQRDKDEWLSTDFKTHEPIIDDELFQRAQEIRLIRGGGSRGGHMKPVNVFAKIIRCKHCCSAMVTMSSISRGKKYYYLMCSKRRRIGVKGCDNGKWIPYFEMRDEIIGWVEKRIKEYLNIEAGTESVVNQLKELDASNNRNEKELKRLKTELEQKRSILGKLRGLYLLGDLDDAQFTHEKSMHEKDIAQLVEKVQEMEAEERQQKDYSLERQRIMDAVTELTTLNSNDDVEKVRITLGKIINEIIIDSDGNVDVYTLLGKLA